MNKAPQCIIYLNDELRLKQEYIFAYSFSDGFTEHLFGFDLIIKDFREASLYYSGFQLEEKQEVLKEVPKSIWDFLEYVDKNELPFSEYSFDTGLYISNISAQQIFLNWNGKSYFISVEGTSKIHFTEKETEEWKLQFKKILVFLENLASKKRKTLVNKKTHQ
ncbi:hypothetical protein [Chryseobacterium luquanense]|uniref:Uncharacterized protein n=1 Tax=Chryseobacterium luquanense TaxID=2983766 RepID=A0ABT3Y4Q3_9FLAO|nr:hypothetical protein [Chryseobacterium luquanense]MCX8533137.1 hypothetical protein [Chryseobacterium luquanense]